MRYDVLIVIPSFNRRELLAECLDSALAAVESSGYAGRVVVVDNASWDESAELVETRFPDVALIANDVNLGFAAACNQGGRFADSRYVVLLNNDATLDEAAVSTMIAYADGNPDTGAVTGRLLDLAGREHYPARHMLDRLIKPPQRIHELSWVPGTCVLLRREALDEIGWLDEDFFFYNEDLDLSWRLKAADWRLVYHPEVVVHHHGGGSSGLIKPRATLEAYRGALLLTRKHRGPWAYACARFALRAWVGLQLLALRLRRLVSFRDLTLIARIEGLEAVRSVLRAGIEPREAATPGDPHPV